MQLWDTDLNTSIDGLLNPFCSVFVVLVFVILLCLVYIHIGCIVKKLLHFFISQISLKCLSLKYNNIPDV